MRILTLSVLLGIAFAGCLTEEHPIDPEPYKPALAFRSPVDLGSKAGPMGAGAGAFGTSCQDSVDDGDCGLGEPSIEVDGAGTIYISGVCCLTVAPPVYASRDGGATFSEMEGDTVRQAFGIEGDFAVDAMGRMYFADIEFAGTFQVTVWEADGTYVRHTKWPAPPLVDRDWIRAEGDGHVYYVYNTGTTTRVYKSVDAAETFTPDAIYVAPYALGNTAILPEQELCLFGGSLDGMRRMDCSRDGGVTWDVEASSLPVGDDAYPVGAYDEAGTLWLAEAVNGAITYVTRTFDGEWSDPVAISPPGDHRMPWIASGADGAAAIAWYGSPAATAGQEWYLYAAATKDGATWDHVIADPEPVFQGALGRDLLDFLQIDIDPDGAVHIAYSKQRPGEGPDGNEEQLHYVRSEPSPLAMNTFWLGP